MSVSIRSADYYTGPQAGPMTLDAGKAAFAQLQRDRPDLFAGAPPPGKRRGIDVYEPHSLQQVFRVACNIFHEAHSHPHLTRRDRPRPRCQGCPDSPGDPAPCRTHGPSRTLG